MGEQNWTAHRVDRLRKSLQDQGVDALLVTDETNVRYLTGFTGDSTSLLVTQSDLKLISDRRYEVQLQEECSGIPAEIRGPDKRPAEWICLCIESLGLEKVGLEDHSVNWGSLKYFQETLPNVKWEATSSIVLNLRAIKDESELRLIRRAIHISERAFNVLKASLRPSMTELDAAYLMESAIRSFGGSGVGFSTIIASGPAGALPHYHPKSLPIQQNQGLLIDWGARFGGYTSDMTRTLSIGKISAKMREVYPVVLDAHLAAIEQVRPGARMCDIDAAARNVIEKAGFGWAFGHGLGHGIGLNVHEQPRLASIETGELKEGMVITIEPGIYLPGELGVRIEDDVLVTNTGHEVLCSVPKGLEENAVIL